MRKGLAGVLVFCITCIITPVFAGPRDWNLNERLRNDLLKNYSKQALPKHGGPNDTVNVYFNLLVKGLWIEEDRQILHLNAWVAM
ncbi:hypothetical protein SK128_017635, partial [Halocaridina rubra]